MSKQKPSLPKGTRDFGPAEMNKRHFILETIKKVYQKYGYAPIETPAMENLSVLQGKYGDEGDQLLFKILDSGDYIEKARNASVKRKFNIDSFNFITDVFYQLLLEMREKKKELTEVEDVFNSEIFSIRIKKNTSSFTKIPTELRDQFFKNVLDAIINIENEISNKRLLTSTDEEFNSQFDVSRQEFINNFTDFLIKSNLDNFNELLSSSLTQDISEKGLRYDLTVPFARFVVMNQNELTFPFKRYQIQPVWRADKPQKGRYREFFQCDADTIGTDSLLCEAEIVLMIKEVFTLLQAKKPGSLDYSIKINNRKILSGLVEVLGETGRETDFAVAIDKLDKIGQDKVKEELKAKGFSEAALAGMDAIFNLSGPTKFQLSQLQTILENSATGLKGIEELQEMLAILGAFGEDIEELELDITLARGLSYYTGAIFEVKPNNVKMGSISGGGRYDGLTDNFGLPGVSGVGISFGVDRIYDVLNELALYPTDQITSTDVLITSFDQESWNYGLQVLAQLRKADIKSELYPSAIKIKKQMKYGNDKQIPFVILIGSEEVKSGQLTFKDMLKGEQLSLSTQEIIEFFNK
ncbi:MAG: histidyl-tRNA synthetase [Marivirga sp.]|jgi:histidyl-tRNA synthetase